MRTYYLYALIDPILEVPKYVGITNNPKERLRKHLEDKSTTKKTKWIQNLKNGGKVPSMKVLKSTTDVQEVIKWEVDTIREFSTLYPLTNSTEGGEYYGIGTPIDVYTLSGEFIGSYNSMTEFCEEHNKPITFVSSIKDSCKKLKSYGDQWIFRYLGDMITKEDVEKAQTSYSHLHSGHFLIVNIESKQIVGEFDKFVDAELAGFGKANRIGECLNKKPKANSLDDTYFVLSTIEEYPERLKNYLGGLQHNSIGKWIAMYDLNGKFIRHFKTLSECARYCNTSSLTSIKACLNNKQVKAYNYMWAYSNSTSNIENYNIRYKKYKQRKAV